MSRRRLGFTLVELIVGIAIITGIVGAVVYGFQSYARYQEYEHAVASVLATLHDARVDARAASNGGAQGVRVQQASLIRFVGDTYNASAGTNETYSFANVRITAALTGSATDMVFEPLTGRPSVTGTITVAGTQHLATTTITITGTGVIQ